jgi:hypothetical protein
MECIGKLRKCSVIILIRKSRLKRKWAVFDCSVGHFVYTFEAHKGFLVQEEFHESF